MSIKTTSRSVVSADMEPRYAILEFERSAAEQLECAWEQRAVGSETLGHLSLESKQG